MLFGTGVPFLNLNSLQLDTGIFLYSGILDILNPISGKPFEWSDRFNFMNDTAGNKYNLNLFARSGPGFDNLKQEEAYNTLLYTSDYIMNLLKPDAEDRA